MKAAVYYHTGPPDMFRYEDVRDPKGAPDGVLVEVEAISIEGGDVGNRARGEMPRVPHVVGYECAGAIREVGASVTERRVGDRVVAMMWHGSHAERVAAPAGFTFLIPNGLATEVAACVPIAFGTADARKFFYAVQEITRGHGCDLVVDSVGGAALQWSLECLAYQRAASRSATPAATTRARRLDDFLERNL